MTARRVVTWLGVFAIACGLVVCYGIARDIFETILAGDAADLRRPLYLSIMLPLLTFGMWSLIVGGRTLRAGGPPSLHSLPAILALALYLFAGGAILQMFQFEPGPDGGVYSVLNLILVLVCSSLYVALSQYLISARTGRPFRICIPNLLIAIIGFHVLITSSAIFFEVAHDRLREGGDWVIWWSFGGIVVPILATAVAVKAMQRWGTTRPLSRSFVLTRKSRHVDPDRT